MGTSFHTSYSISYTEILMLKRLLNHTFNVNQENIEKGIKTVYFYRLSLTSGCCSQKLTEAQLSLCRDIRRRGKNKVSTMMMVIMMVIMIMIIIITIMIIAIMIRLRRTIVGLEDSRNLKNFDTGWKRQDQDCSIFHENLSIFMMKINQYFINI